MCPVSCEYLRRARACHGETIARSGTARLNQRRRGRAVPLGATLEPAAPGEEHLGETASVKVAVCGRCRILTRICISLCESGRRWRLAKASSGAETCGRGLPSLSSAYNQLFLRSEASLGRAARVNGLTIVSRAENRLAHSAESATACRRPATAPTQAPDRGRLSTIRSVGVGVMLPSPSIVPADWPSRRLSLPLYDKAPFQRSGLRGRGFAASASPMPPTWRYSTSD
ncbi:hypothetical protein ACVWWI_002774 [Bradyrhizobium sp. USDA 3686]|nr:hypothetical protein [Bradyrhizobium canariense]